MLVSVFEGEKKAEKTTRINSKFKISSKKVMLRQDSNP